MIVETQIGQLRINKNQVIKTEDVLPPIANLEFVGDAIEEIYSDKRAYQGNIKNTGLKRADFVRVIYSMYDQNSNLIASDSAFISGSKKIFINGLINPRNSKLKLFNPLIPLFSALSLTAIV